MIEKKNRAKVIAERLILKRNEYGLNQEELAKKAGLSRTTIYKIENGKSIPRYSTLERIAKVLGTNPNYFESGELDINERIINKLKNISDVQKINVEALIDSFIETNN